MRTQLHVTNNSTLYRVSTYTNVDAALSKRGTVTVIEGWVMETRARRGHYRRLNTDSPKYTTVLKQAQRAALEAIPA